MSRSNSICSAARSACAPGIPGLSWANLGETALGRTLGGGVSPSGRLHKARAGKPRASFRVGRGGRRRERLWKSGVGGIPRRIDDCRPLPEARKRRPIRIDRTVPGTSPTGPKKPNDLQTTKSLPVVRPRRKESSESAWAWGDWPAASPVPDIRRASYAADNILTPHRSVSWILWGKNTDTDGHKPQVGYKVRACASFGRRWRVVVVWVGSLPVKSKED
jgi:hypothetical protein